MKKDILLSGILGLLVFTVAMPTNAQSIGVFDGFANIGEISEEGFGDYLADMGIYIIDGTGSSIGYRSFQDSCQFLYKEMNSDFGIECRPYVLGNGRAGLMIRQSLEPGSKQISFMLQTNGTIFPTFRTVENGPNSNDGEVESPIDTVVRMERRGNSVSLLTLDENFEWTVFQTEILEFSGPVYAGVAVSNEATGNYNGFEFEEVYIDEYPLHIERSTADDETITITASAASIVSVTVDEIITDNADISDMQVTGGEIVVTEDGNQLWVLQDFSGEATLTYTLNRLNNNRVIFRGTYTDGLDGGTIGGVLSTSEPIAFKPRSSFTVNPNIPTFIEFEWGTIAADQEVFGLQFDPRTPSGVTVQANQGSGSSIPDTILEYTLDVQETGTYYFFASMRREDSQSDSIFIGFDEVFPEDDYGLPLGGSKNYSINWMEHYDPAQRFWNRTGEKRGFELTAGQHTFLVAPRETGAKLDWFVITTDPTIVATTFTPIERNFNISRSLPSIDAALPASVPVTIQLSIVNQPNLLIFETTPKGWTVGNINASAGTALQAESDIIWTVSSNADATLTYDLTPSPDAKFGAWFGEAVDLDKNFTAMISGDQYVPEEISFSLLTDPIDIGTDTVFIQAEYPHSYGGDMIVKVDPFIPSQLYVEGPTSGRIGSDLTGSQITFDLNFLQDGTYYLFFNVRGESPTQDSFFVGFDEIANDMSYGLSLPHGEFAREWRLEIVGANFWDVGENPMPYEISQGLHTFIIHTREPNSKIDWFAITMDPTLDLETILEPGQDEPPTGVHDYMLY
jgi:hypothetical protein